MSGRIEGKIALVVGAAQGIGEAIAKRFVEEGAKVVIADVLDEVGQATAERLSGIYVHTDISDFEAAKVAVKVAVQYYGTLDIIVQNAGIYPWTLIENTPPEEWDQVCAVNLKGTFQTVRASIPTLKAAGAGSVILISSLVGNRVFNMAGASAYAASKAGIVAFGKASALELAKDNIRVNVICPGAFKTNIQGRTICRNRENLTPRVTYPEGTVPLNTDERRNPEKVAQLVWFLASDMANYITGTEVYIDGANLSSWAEVK